MKLSKIFDTEISVDIKKLNIDSRTCVPGSMFFCMVGMQSDGHDHIEQAIAQGACCIVHSKDITSFDSNVVYIKVENVADVLNQVVKKFYDNPSDEMMVYAVTGTNGKTTITNIISDLLNHFTSCGYIGTICIKYNDVVMDAQLTTPDAITLHDTLYNMKQVDVKAVALEVSSHGLELKRSDAIDIDVAIFSNFTHDHIDFHGSMEAYFGAKCKLFKNLKEDGMAIINRDDAKASEVIACCKSQVVTYGMHPESTYCIKKVELHAKCSNFSLIHNQTEYEIKTNLAAIYNIYNLVAAIAALVETGIEIQEILKYVNHISQIDGRLEVIDEGQPFNVVVDFAHTPDGLRKIFEYAKEITPVGNEIITVFGSAGKRDKAKRKTFGEIADQFCDYIILTEDDPRDENIKDIADEIREGISETRTIFIENRYDAIRVAIENANLNDSVFILGKGSEVFMYTKKGKSEWMGDHNAAREIIRKYYFEQGNTEENN